MRLNTILLILLILITTVSILSCGGAVAQGSSGTSNSSSDSSKSTQTPVSITTASLPSATSSTAYSAQLAASGGQSPYQWTVASGSLPTGLALSTSGVLAGIPTQSGTFSFTVSTADSEPTPQIAAQSFSLHIQAPALPTLSITTVSLPGATSGVAYSTPLAATGGQSPYTWALASGTLPTGLTLNTTSGVLAGTPSQSGTFNFTVSATDSETTPKVASQSLSLVVQAAVPALSITTTSLSNATSGTAYSATLAASGGQNPYTWALASGTLPTGLTLNSTSGVLAGTPSQTGTFSFTVSATDSENMPKVASQALSLVVQAAVPTLSITTTSLSSATSGIAYSTTLTATGGQSPYKWALASGTLPTGITVSAAGVLAGTPSQSGTFSFTVSATDSESTTKTVNQALSLVVQTPLSITTTSLPNGQAGTAYSATVTAAGGVSPYSWSLYSGALPTGLSLAGSTGVISGTPSIAGTFNVTLAVQDAQGTSMRASLAITIAAVAALQITTTALPNGIEGTSYNATVAASGGTPPYTWSLVAGSLPSTVALAATSGVISGDPTTSGTFTPVLQVTDSQQHSTSQTFSFTISSSGPSSTYNIGPGKTYTTIGAAPWSSLQPGDTVNIYPQTAITCTTASASSGTTITCTGSTAAIPYGSTAWFSGMAGITHQSSGANWGMPWITCGVYGSGLYGTAKGGSACSSNQITLSNAVNVGSGVTVYFTPPYFEKLIVTATGTASQPITINGIPDPTTGAMPTLDADNATTGPNMAHTGSTQYHDAYGFVEFFCQAGQCSYGNAPLNKMAAYITMTGLRIQGGRSGVTEYDGTNTAYTLAAGTGIRVEDADHLTLSGNEFVNNDDGVFGAMNPNTNPSFVINNPLVRGNHFWQNGNGYGAHQTYIEAANIVYEFNWYDQPAFGAAYATGCSPSTGSCCSQLKDRSSGTVIRYNTFYPSARMIDLVDAQNSRDENVPAVLLTSLVPTSTGFSSGATSLTFTGSVSGVQMGDFLGFIDNTNGWGYSNSGAPVMPIVTAVNTSTNTLTVSPGIPRAIPGNIAQTADELMSVHQTTNSYKQSFVYGNIFDRDQSLYWAQVGAVAHYGWDTAPGIDSVTDRAGTLYFYNNTIIERWDLTGSTGAMYGDNLFQTESSADNIRADNNVIYVTNSNSSNSATYQQLMSGCSYCTLGVVGNFNGSGNQIAGTWYWSSQSSAVYGTITQSGVTSKTLAQLYPSGLSGRNYSLQSGSSAIGAASALPAAVTSNSLGLDLTPYYDPNGTTRTTVVDVGAYQHE